MPLRDHFRPPVENKHSWDELHGGWPMVVVQQLYPILPEGYVAAPSVHLGTAFEIDVAAYEEPDEYEVRVYDARHGRRLVAAIELISPGNKDRPENRRAFVAKTAALLQHDVCVSLVDVVTIRQFNLYADLLALAGGSERATAVADTFLYAATLRGRKRPRGRPLLDAWFYPLEPGRPLPQLPISLEVDLGVFLDLEKSYEETCRALHIA